jgi:predicted ATPase
MGQLSLAFLGEAEIRHAGRLVALPTRKALALLTYLAVEGGVHSREKLSALFWPESDSAQGRATLRSTLALLRDSFGAHDAHLLATRDSLAFDTASEFELDVWLVQAAAQATRELPLISRLAPASTPQPANVRALLGQLKGATGRYRGDFLEGFSLSDAPEFDTWASFQRESLHRQATLVFDWLSQLQFEGGELVGAVETAARWVAHDVLSEAAHRRLMQLHFAAGDRAAALQAYEACRAVLERELQADPAPETEALADRIRRERVSARSGEGLSEATRSFTPSPFVLLAESPMVGRAAEHMALVAAYRLAYRGSPQAVLVEGEPGIGKTRLAKEFLAWARAQGADVLQGRAFETGGIPYYPIAEALRERLGCEPDLRRLLSDTWLAELSRLLPELADRLPGLPAPLAPGEAEARTRLFEVVMRIGQALADRAPLVLFVDDVQWADSATLEVLSYASRRWAALGARVLLLLAGRSEDLRAPGAGDSRATLALADWFASIHRDIPLTQVALSPLTREDTERLLQALIGAPRMEDRSPSSTLDPRSPLEPFSQWLFGETGGHPFFIIQTLKSLSERDLLHRDEAGAWALAFDTAAADIDLGHVVPAGVQELIRGRLTRLSPQALLACSAGAVLGDGCDFDSLRRVGGLDEPDGLVALEELLQRGLLRESGGRYFFAHDKLREVVYAEISDARRRIYHRRALQALESTAASPARLVRHALAAGLGAPAFRYSLAAGDEALRLFAVRAAIAHLEQARRLLTGEDGQGWQIPAADRDHLYLQLGRAYEFINNWEQALSAYQTLLTLVRTASRPETECAALNRMATVAAQGFFDLPKALALLHEAQQVAERSGDHVRLADTEWNLAQINFYVWNIKASLAHGQRALTLARDLGQQELMARGLNIIAYNMLMLGYHDEVEAHADESRALCEAIGNRAMEADSLSIQAILRVYWGRLQEGITAARAGMSIGREIENPWGQANCAYIFAQGLLDSGAWTEALAVARDGVAAARAAGHPPTLVFNLLSLGRVYRAHFALAEALPILRESRVIAEALEHPFLLEWTAIELCADCVAAGDWDEAYTHALQALSARDYGQVYVGFTRWHETEALLRGGSLDQAAEDARRMGGQFKGNRRYHLQELRARAVLAESAGDTGQAITHLEAARAIAEGFGLLNECWQLDSALGNLYLARGDQPRARRSFTQAAELVRRLANTIDDQSLRVAFLAGEPVRQVLEL